MPILYITEYHSYAVRSDNARDIEWPSDEADTLGTASELSLTVVEVKSGLPESEWPVVCENEDISTADDEAFAIEAAKRIADELEHNQE